MITPPPHETISKHQPPLKLKLLNWKKLYEGLDKEFDPASVIGYTMTAVLKLGADKILIIELRYAAIAYPYQQLRTGSFRRN